MNYLDKINTLYQSKKATEHSYRPALKEYIEALLPGITATNEPKRQRCGAPDYIITRNTRGNAIDIGYIEAKDIGIDLDKTEKDEQLTRYKESLDNLILTDYLDFRFFKEGKKVSEVKIAKVEHGKVIPLPDGIKTLETLLQDFAAFQGQTINSAKTLAVMMARKAKLMQEVLCKALLQEDEHISLKGQLEAFRRILIHDMTAEDFSDVYSQTITYGLFTARMHDEAQGSFSRMEALNLIPMSNPFLRKLFQYVAVELDDGIAWIVDALCELLRVTSMRDIMSDFGKQTGRDDPVIHFYETFLSEYNAQLRKERGVWYTPEPVVNFIVRAIDDCLKEYFHLPAGIADTSKVKIKTGTIDNTLKKGRRIIEKEVHKVQLLDVATGTGTFISEVIKQIYNGHFQHQQGMWSNYMDEHLLPRLHGFEILMASYAMCHMKIDLLLQETGYKPKNDKKPPRLGVYLTNSLEEAHPDSETLFASWLSAEANEANEIKRDMPVMVAMGNPPYNVSTQNKGKWIQDLIADYKTGLNEKNINSLSDDYIKFIRYSEHYIEKTGYGIVALITNNSFLDGVTHRQMRKHLLETFDTIYIYDLHGSAKKKETAPDGSQDQNVFDIQQGASISIFIKHKASKTGLAEVWHYDSYGKRQIKYAKLWSQSLKDVPFEKLKYKQPYYFFAPKDFEGEKEYKGFFSIDNIFPISNSGIKTHRDDLVVDANKQILTKRINKFYDHAIPDYEIKQSLEIKETSNWKLGKARQDIFDESNISKICYRPFDIRHIYYKNSLIDRPRQDLMRHLISGENIALLLKRSRLLGGTNDYRHVSICNTLVDLNYLADQTFCFPLYLYPAGDEQLSLGGKQNRMPNLDMKIVQQIAKKLCIQFVPDHEISLSSSPASGGKTAFSPLDLLDYIYAVLHSPTYRETYKEFLKIDFPRIPYPDNVETFWKLVALGREIRLLHLMESPALSKLITSYPISGDNLIEKIVYENGKVHINKEQYFDNVPEIAWNFYIGGYQPAQKWLKDRKSRNLNFDDITHYQKIIIALTETARLMKEIDAVWKP